MIEAEVLVESNNWRKIIKNPKRLILSILKKFPNRYKFVNKKAYISVLLTDNHKIRLLNKKFRKKNKPTDILSFPSFTKNELSKNLKKKEIYLGDIIISYQYIFPKKKDLLLESTFIHGFLHLLGHDHKKLQDFKIMNKEFRNMVSQFAGTKTVLYNRALGIADKVGENLGGLPQPLAGAPKSREDMPQLDHESIGGKSGLAKIEKGLPAGEFNVVPPFTKESKMSKFRCFSSLKYVTVWQRREL